MEKRLSLRLVILIPVFILIVFSLLMINLLLRGNLIRTSNYNSERIINTVSEQVQVQLKTYLDLAYFASMQFAFTVAESELYKPSRSIELEKFMRNNYKNVLTNIEQVGYSAVGTEDSYYMGYRKEPDKSFTLMVKDDNTDGNLIIFRGDNRMAEEIARYPGYDPRTRPWYKVARDKASTVWSEMYTDYDENQAITITASSPIISQGVFRGVVGFDVKLNMLYRFIRDIAKRYDAVVFVTDVSGKLISTSEGSPVLSDGTGGTVKGERLRADISAHPVVKSIAGHYMKSGGVSLNRLTPEAASVNDLYYYKVFPFFENGGLEWQVYIAIPESVLTGSTRRFFATTQILILSLLALIFLLLLAGLNMIIGNIKRIADGARMITDGDWNFRLKEKSLVEEFHTVSTLFNSMTKSLTDATVNLEQKVEERSRELKDTQTKLFEAEKMSLTTKLVAGIAHEINTPVGISITSVTYLQSHIESLRTKMSEHKISHSEFDAFVDTAKQSIDITIRNLIRAADLVKIFKNLSVDQINQVKRQVNMKEYLEGIMKSMYYEFRNTPYTYTITVSDESIISYPDAFSQILVNLTMNSLYHGFSGRSSGEVTVNGHIAGDRYVITYEDNGIGLTDEEKLRIYEPFFTSKRSEGRVGLGMNIVYNLITDKLHGTITLDSVQGKFTRFIISFPLEM